MSEERLSEHGTYYCKIKTEQQKQGSNQCKTSSTFIPVKLLQNVRVWVHERERTVSMENAVCCGSYYGTTEQWSYSSISSAIKALLHIT